MFSGFTPSHRGGSGPPIVCLHGFMETWRSWELVLARLEARHEVLALTLPGHAGGQPLAGGVTFTSFVDAVERAMVDAGLELAHLVGSSLGGYVALELATRGRALTVVALAPAGGWAQGDHCDEDLLSTQRELHAQMKLLAPQAEAILATQAERRRATSLTTTNFEHIPTDLLAHQMLGIAGCKFGEQLIDAALQGSWPLRLERVTCPVRIIWGTADQLLPWPRAAVRYQTGLPQTDWVLLDGSGHSLQLDVPLETAQLILDFTT